MGTLRMLLKDICQKGIGFLSRNGMLGRKKQVISSLSWEKDAGYNVNKKEWIQFYEAIRKQYIEIRLHKLWSTRVGEYGPRYLTAVEDSQRNAARGILDVFVLSDCVSDNSRLSRIMGRNIQIIDKSNIEMWNYILCHFPKVEFTKYWDEYATRKKDVLFLSQNTVQYFQLTEEEEREGQYKKETMGLYTPYVCASSRDSVYLSTIYPTEDTHYHDYRDSDINCLKLSADYLLEKKISMVRMGRYVKDKVNFNNCIDYANQYYDELMDIILMRDCKFFVGDSNGLCFLPMALNSPVALKNVTLAFEDIFGTHPQNNSNLFIFKKYYKEREHKFLSIKEMMQIDKKVRHTGYDGNKYADLGIKLIENSAEEILDLVMEMNQRLDGEWMDTPEDIELQKKYQTIFKEWCIEEQLNENAIYRGKIGAMFLRKNSFLLN